MEAFIIFVFCISVIMNIEVNECSLNVDLNENSLVQTETCLESGEGCSLYTELNCKYKGRKVEIDNLGIE